MKWVFKRKNDGRYHARLVALGFHQKAGVDFTDIHAPVMHEVTLRILMLIKLVTKWKAVKMDVETAFLESKITNTTYIKLPKGLDETESINQGDIGQLNAAIYGLVQASRSFYRSYTACL